MSDPVRYEVDGRVAVITINRPEKRNALNRAAREGLFEAFREADADDTVRAVILTGAGDKAFCSGADLTEMAETGLTVPGRDFSPRLRQNVTVEVPVIAAVNGAALAGGFLLAQMCDLCVAADTATFAISEARWGRGAPWSAPLGRMIPQRIMLELLLTGEPLPAARMYEVGFVNRVVPLDELMDAAHHLASVVASNAPLTVAGHLEMTYHGGDVGVSAAEDYADAIFERVYSSEDAQEGPRAFREKREPVWKGR